MAKSRAQRKAERRAREAALGNTEGESEQGKAQHDTQVPVSGDIAEIEAVEAGIAAGASESDLETPDAPKLSSKQEKRQQKAAEKAKKAEQKRREEQQLAKSQKKAKVERKRGGVWAFQWPDRETLIQATAVTVVFVLVAAVYLGVLDLIVNWVVQRII